MKLSISTIKLLCSLWNYVEEILDDKEYLQRTLNYLESCRYSYPLTEQERETAIEEIKALILDLI